MDFTNIIISTYATEKTHKAQTNDVAPKYSFIVAMKASKEQILLAFQSLYGVRATNISTQIRKSVRVKKGTDKPGFSQAFKIAHISLEKGLKLNMTEEELTK
jgi:ribosomal protein L23